MVSALQTAINSLRGQRARDKSISYQARHTGSNWKIARFKTLSLYQAEGNVYVLFPDKFKNYPSRSEEVEIS